MAPCIGLVSKEEYRKQINEIIELLEGKTDKIIKSINKQIKEASDNLDFEKAAYLRDKKIAIEHVSEKQKVSNISENNIDVIRNSKIRATSMYRDFFCAFQQNDRQGALFFSRFSRYGE